jgi:hypothetical protein
LYSHEPHEPPHVHVDACGCTANFWRQPVALTRNIGFNGKELAELPARVRQRSDRRLLWKHGMGVLGSGADEGVHPVGPEDAR